MEEPHFIKCESVTESSPNLNTEESLPISVENIKVEPDLVFTDECTEEHSLGIVKEELDIQDVKEQLDDTCGPSMSEPEVSHADLLSLGPACFRCDHCHENFTHSSTLLRHMRTHTGEMPYQCTVCGKSFSSSGSLLKHNRVHTGLRPHVCSVCNKTFAVAGRLTRHMRIHTGERPYLCTICNMAYSQSSSLSKHLKSHTGERPFKCSLCTTSFSQKCHLQVPIQYCCAYGSAKCFTGTCKPPHCGKVTWFTGEVHMRMHTGERPYKCEVCGKSFIRSNTLIRHRRIHTGERPYKCAVCCRMFTLKSHLSVHMQLHTGGRRYGCPVCGKTFAHESTHSKHLKTHLPKRSLSQ